MFEQYTPLGDPADRIRNWVNRSRGQASAQVLSPADVVYTHVDGQQYFGLPMDPRRLIPNYIQEGDTVLVWGHPDANMEDQLNTPETLCRINPREWLDWDPYARFDWSDEMVDPGRTLVVPELAPQGVRRSYYWYAAATLALPLEVHLERQAQLVEAHQWFDWVDDPTWVCA